LSLLLLACGALVLLSALFVLRPLRRDSDAPEDASLSNLEWVRLREQELSGDDNETLREDVRLRLLEDDQQGSGSASSTATTPSRFPAWVLLPGVAIAAGILYYLLGAAPDVMISRQLQTIDEQSPPQAMSALIVAIEKRAAQRPDNQHYTALLGRYYMGQRDYGRAAETYGALAASVPEDAQALAYAAQAEYLAAGRTLSDDARMKAEQALAVNPHQRTALGLLGMASFEQGEYRAAIEYWQRLLAMEAPGSESANMIAGVIETARERLGEVPAEQLAATTPAAQRVTTTPPAVDASGGAGVTVRVNAPQGIDPGDTVFILARNAESGSRMPIAVRRLTADQLPVTLRLDDSNSMAGQKLSDTESVMVVVQVSPDGRPGEATASWLGQIGPLAPSTDVEPVEVILRPRES
jgi:cytochrome c-type biogenesis protein CcmH